jgi:hypothetical protein
LIIVRYVQLIQPAKVAHDLQTDRELLFLYLDELFEKDPQEGLDFHNEMVGLYADYDTERLSHFLKTSQSYSFPKVGSIHSGL